MQYLLKSDGFKLELQYEEECHSEIKLGVYVFSKGFSANAYMDVSKTAWENSYKISRNYIIMHWRL